MSLKQRLRDQIRQDGPMSVAQFMTLCLHDPQDGYYATRAALGEAGDFITAPLVSQMFGELLGLWAAETWRRLGSPPEVIFAEAGPGDGTLMHDALRAARLAPDFLAAAELWLVEPSPALRARQAERLGDARPQWAGGLAGLPRGRPLILIANEVLDCLPTRQFVRTAAGWAERLVGLDEREELAFGLAARPLEGLAPEAPEGAVWESSPAQAAFAAELADRVAADGGAALLIDYGRDAPGFGDTLQALRRHRKVPPLDCPGEADLTVHVDFPAVADAARRAGAQASPILAQADLLLRLGIGQRAQSLARARPDRADRIKRQLDRLVGTDQMGALFKALVIHSEGLTPPGFEET